MNMRIVLASGQDTSDFGKLLAEALLAESDAPLRAFYFYGDLGSGKTTLTRSFVAALPGGDMAEVASPSFTLCNEYPTAPLVLHADLYRLGQGAFLPEEMEESLENGAILVLEWAEYLANEVHNPERIDICLEVEEAVFPVGSVEDLDIIAHSCERKRLANIRAHGKAGDLFFARLRPALEARFTIIH